MIFIYKKEEEINDKKIINLLNKNASEWIRMQYRTDDIDTEMVDSPVEV